MAGHDKEINDLATPVSCVWEEQPSINPGSTPG